MVTCCVMTVLVRAPILLRDLKNENEQFGKIVFNKAHSPFS